jgi:restriction endonuclease Mrr
MHDNDPKHTLAIVKDSLRDDGIQVMQWPSSFQDLNPIEHLWDVLEDRVEKHVSKNKTELVQHLIEKWNKIDLSVLEKLVDSIPSRWYECMKMKGYATRY